MLKKKFENNYEHIIKQEIEKKKQEVILREKIDIWNMITSMKDNNELEKLKQKIIKEKKKKKWKIWD